MIHTIKWREQLVAWAGLSALRLFDLEERAVITFIKRETDIRNCRCCLNWLADDELLVGWGCSVKSCKIGQRSAGDVVDKRTPRKYVYIPYLHELDRVVCGVAPFTSPNHLLLLTLGPDLQGDMEQKIPHVQVLELPDENSDKLIRYNLDQIDGKTSNDCREIEEIASDNLPDNQVLSDIMLLRGYESCTYSDYRFQNLIEDRLYFIIAPNDVVIGKPREPDDHISWLIEKNRFEQALADARHHSDRLHKHSASSVGRLYIRHLLDLNQEPAARKAAALSREVLGTSTAGWEEVVISFLQLHQLHLLEPFLPVKMAGVLSPQVSELILNHFLENDTQTFARLVQNWPPSTYNVQQTLSTLKSALHTSSDDRFLNEALAALHVHNGQFEQALIDYISLGDRVRTFDLIRDRRLVSSLREKLEVLMRLDADRTAELLIEHREQISIEYVVGRLQRDKTTGATFSPVSRSNLKIEQQRLLLPYLDRVVQLDPELAVEWHQMLVELYAEHAPERLMRFLKTSTHYSLEKALQVCRTAKRMPEAVFLLSRMGNAEQALHCILTELNDFEQAIDFCREHGDVELWQQLSKHTLDRPEAIRVLLDTVGASLPDPIAFIDSIPEQLQVPGLRTTLGNVLHDCTARLALERSCRRIMLADCFDLSAKLNSSQKRGVAVSRRNLCNTCTRPLLTAVAQSDIVAFRCGHVFHEPCLAFEPSKKSICPVCIDPNRLD
jgi:tetratricopeptide (TPR) repeat protein